MSKTLAAHITAKLNHIDGFEPDEQIYLRDLAFTLSEKRSRLQWATYAVASRLDELAKALSDANTQSLQSRAFPTKPRVAFVFTGQGAQWPKMGHDLMAYQSFRQSVHDADRYLRTELGCTWSAVEELARSDHHSNVHEAAYSHILCTILQVALVDLLETWNVTPVAVAGHSSGEIAAAYCMGALSAKSAWKIAYYRGLLSSRMRDLEPDLHGAMMAVGAPLEQVETYITAVSKGDIGIACVNSPSSVTVSGDAAGVDELEHILKANGTFAKRLRVDTAYHSAHMRVIAQSYLEAIADVQTLEGLMRCRMHSSVTDGTVGSDELGPVAWIRNLLSPVLFADAVRDMIRPSQEGGRATENAVDVIIEIGPHSALRGAVSQIMNAHGIDGIEYLPLLVRGRSGIDTALECAGALHAVGASVNIRQANEDNGSPSKPVVDLPPYPWNHASKFWSETRLSKQYRSRSHAPTALLGAPVPAFGEGEHIWRGFLRSSEEPWVKDHRIQGSNLYPAAGFLTMAIEAALQIAERGKVVRAVKLRDMSFSSALIVPEDSHAECILQLRPHLLGTRAATSTWYEMTVNSATEAQELRQNCSGLLLLEYEAVAGSSAAAETEYESRLAAQRWREADDSCTLAISGSDFYKKLASHGLDYGPAFAKVNHVRVGRQTSSCRLAVEHPGPAANTSDNRRPHLIHPTTLDAILHLAFAALQGEQGELRGAMVPTKIDEIVICSSIPFGKGAPLKGFSTINKRSTREAVAAILMLDEKGTEPVVRIDGLHLADVSSDGPTASTDSASRKICSAVTWRPVADLLSSHELRTVLGPGYAPLSNETVATIRYTDNDRLDALSRFVETHLAAHGCVPQILKATFIQDSDAKQEDMATFTDATLKWLVQDRWRPVGSQEDLRFLNHLYEKTTYIAYLSDKLCNVSLPLAL